MSSKVVKFIPFIPIEKRGKYQLKLIQPHPVAVTQYQRRVAGFVALGAYLSGENDSHSICIETQPIVMTHNPGDPKIMQVYVVPSDEHNAVLPIPLDSAVYLDAAGGEVIAAARFEGNATEEACEAIRIELLSELAKDGLKVTNISGQRFQLAQFGPLHSLTTRINEIWIRVEL